MSKILSSEQRFRKVYASLPINVRAEIIIVIKNEPISWNLAFKEIEKNTQLGKEILERIEKLEFI